MTSLLTCVILGKKIGMHQPMEEDEFLTKCVVDPAKRTFYLYSSEGDEKEVTCDNIEEFMGVLSFVRATCPEERLSYANPIIS